MSWMKRSSLSFPTFTFSKTFGISYTSRLDNIRDGRRFQQTAPSWIFNLRITCCKKKRKKKERKEGKNFGASKKTRNFLGPKTLAFDTHSGLHFTTFSLLDRASWASVSSSFFGDCSEVSLNPLIGGNDPWPSLEIELLTNFKRWHGGGFCFKDDLHFFSRSTLCYGLWYGISRVSRARKAY